MSSVFALYDKLVEFASGRFGEGLALLFTRIVLAAPFWFSGRTKVEEGSLLAISDVQYIIFENEFSGLPLPSSLAVPMATYAEFFFPILLVLGLATRFSALSLLIMTLMIQFFVFPDAWWTAHAFWAALAVILISRGPGIISLDAILASRRAK
jgi:putative oxidoreductase